MEDVQLILAALWTSLMLTYLLGDVIRIFAGDFVAGEVGGEKATQSMWMMAAIIMLLPIVMVSLTLILPSPINGWLNIILAVFLFLFNLAGIRGYPSYFDKFLIAVGLVFNVVIVWYALSWLGLV
ncbi:MAG: DUF6326 family protein [Candidatus Thorarchaeota archaeon]